MQRTPKTGGFTLVELILVIFIMCLLTFMMVPMLSQFVKGTKVQQTVSIVTAVLYKARMEATRTRHMVGVFFGDDVTQCKIKPTPGVIPQKGHIEIWTVLDNHANGDWGADAGGSTGVQEPYNNQGPWYPYRYPDQNLTPEPITFPDGVRILAGQFWHNSGPIAYTFGWSNQYNPVADGEIKRHTVTYSGHGTMPGWYDGLSTWWSLLVFDEKTGEHQVISVGQWLMTCKPRVLPFQLTGLYGVSGTYYPIKKNSDIPDNCEK